MLKLSVPDMSCGGCKASVEKVLGPLTVPEGLTFDMAAREIAIPGPVDADQVIAALARIGFPAHRV